MQKTSRREDNAWTTNEDRRLLTHPASVHNPRQQKRDDSEQDCALYGDNHERTSRRHYDALGWNSRASQEHCVVVRGDG